MSIAKQFTIDMENERGTLARLCSELAKVAVNINGIQVPQQAGRVAVRMVASPADVTQNVLEKLGFRYQQEDVLTAHLPDRPGALGKITRKLAEKGVDILYAYGTIEHSSQRAMVVIGVSDLAAASQILK